MKDVSQLLRTARVIMLDFDGPVCAAFAGRPAADIANRLRSTLPSVESADSLWPLFTSSDPFDLLRYAKFLDEGLTEQVHRLLQVEERAAIECAVPTPGGHEFILRATEVGKLVAVVSNNDQRAVESYLRSHDLSGAIASVSARSDADPKHLKPSTTLLRRALNQIGSSKRDAVFLGDAVTDVEAAIAFGVPSIAYANKPGKLKRLTEVGADAVIANMTEATLAIAS